MPKKRGTPALTGERVWSAIKAGSMQARRIHGTRVIHIVRGRIRLTWLENGRKKHTRIRFRSVYLNPRWIKLPGNYPISTAKLLSFNREKLAKMGIVKLRRGGFRLLIYQQLNDLDSLLRQLRDHVQPYYTREERTLWGQLLQTASWKNLTGQNLQTLDRLQTIKIIQRHIRERGKAAQRRITRLRRIQRSVKGALESLLRVVPAKGKLSAGTVKGLRGSLLRQYNTLKPLLDDKSFARGSRWARYHIKRARVMLFEHNPRKARYHIQKAIEHL